jgi:hypothetical protein
MAIRIAKLKKMKNELNGIILNLFRKQILDDHDGQEIRKKKELERSKFNLFLKKDC